MKGTCRYGDKCSFAHGNEELKGKPNLPAQWKTKPCKMFHATGRCDYGIRCHFVHVLPTPNELISIRFAKLGPKIEELTKKNTIMMKPSYNSSNYKTENRPRLPVFSNMKQEYDNEMQ